jgi:anti-sigma regulatory factor (Ser/Thr protein kinase)
MDEFDIRSEVGVGTIVMVRKWLRKNVPELAGLGG